MFFLEGSSIEEANKTLKGLFSKLDFVQGQEQYKILLEISRILLQLKEYDDAFAYLLQATLINPTFESYFILSIISLIKKDSTSIKNFYTELQKLSYTPFNFFSLEELNNIINPIVLEDKLIKKQYDALIALVQQDAYEKNNSSISSNKNISLEKIIVQLGEKATPILEEYKKQSGLDVKYPELNNISIKNWEDEFPDRNRLIAEKETLLAKNIELKQEELIDLGKMYLLDNEFIKAAQCFTQARDLFLTKP